MKEHPWIVYNQLIWIFYAGWNISYRGSNAHWMQCKKQPEIAIRESKIYYHPISAFTGCLLSFKALYGCETNFCNNDIW